MYNASVTSVAAFCLLYSASVCQKAARVGASKRKWIWTERKCHWNTVNGGGRQEEMMM